MTDHPDEHGLQELFGSFRAEWLREKLFSLFDEPAYFPALRDKRPCVLVGGRGTGKTTVLRCMSYQGQFALAGGGASGMADSEYVGLYHRVNTNRVTAFRGPELSERQWQRVFGHYLNLVVAQLLLEYMQWHTRHLHKDDRLSGEACRRVASGLGLDSAESLEELSEAVDEGLRSLETYVNNLDEPSPRLSMLQAPIDELVSSLRQLSSLRGKTFYVMLDEYENYLDYQQQIVNTLIKHAGDGYVFKVGVKELGWRVRSTINESEHLIAPADYDLIHIEDKLEGDFPEFARKVCQTRLEQWAAETGNAHLDLDHLFPELSYEQEADLLGVSSQIGEVRAAIDREPDHQTLTSGGDLPIYVFWMLNDKNFAATLRALREFAAGVSSRKEQYANYKYSMLFSIPGNGAEISKYYCGNRVFARLARNNIRFYLHIIATGIERHRRAGQKLDAPVGYRDQTLAARSVGLQYLTELEGVTVQGVQLVKLILGFGRLFQLLSRNPVGAAPEYVEFQIKKNTGASAEVMRQVASLLREAIMHLALVRSPGTKLATESDIREWDYAVHPIFAAYFGFSHRKKRKLDVTELDVLNMVTQPQETIKKLLRDRYYLADQESPVQLRLFDEYFAGKDDSTISG